MGYQRKNNQMTKPSTHTNTKSRLKELIRQEIEAVLEPEDLALDEANPYHSGKTGRFTKKTAPNSVYSLTKNAEDDVSEVPIGRGRNKNGKPVAKYGMNTGSPEKQCGRLTLDGEKKKKTRRCIDYKKKYWEPQNEDLDPITAMPVSKQQGAKNRTPVERKHALGYDRELQRLAKGIMEGSLEPREAREIYEQASHLRRLSGLPERLVGTANEDLRAKCKAAGFRTFEDLLRAMDAMKRAADGKLLEPPKTTKT